jgi:AcrR family transcriptional regulator
MTTLAMIRGRGRPVKFDQATALNIALELFWTHGFEGTSLNDLTQNMGINRPSLYGTYGNKAALFNLCISAYISQHLGFIDQAIEKPTLIEVIDWLFKGQIKLLSSNAPNRGCFIVQGILNCAEENIEIKEALIEARKSIEGKLRKRIQFAQMKKEIDYTTSPAALAKNITTLYCGLSVQATSGATVKELQEVVNLAQKQWG